MKRRLLSALGAIGLVAAVYPGGGAVARPNQVFSDGYTPGFQGEDSLAAKDADFRGAALRPSAEQLAAVREMGATARWNDFGTPKMLFNRPGYLTEAKQGRPADVARAWVRANAAVFRLDAGRVAPAKLELIAVNPLYSSPDYRRLMNRQQPTDTHVAHVVLFRQRFGTYAAGQDGLLGVGLDPDNRVTIAWSSVTGDTRLTGTRRLDAVAAWRAAARDVAWPHGLASVRVVDAVNHAGFTTLRVPGTQELQLARLRAVPTPRDGVRLAWETDVIDATADGVTEPLAYMSFIDAETGKVLVRSNALDYLNPPTQGVPNPQWKQFPMNPAYPVPGIASPDNRELWCWVAGGASCTRVIGPNGATGLRERSSPNPYDVLPNDAGVGAPTFTTNGNNANTTSSYASHLTPDSPYQPPAPTRDYSFPFTDQWHVSNCNLSGNYASPARNDIDAAISNLFIGHNRMHDWSYYLGHTEGTWNMQYHNYGEDNPGSATAKDGDPEKGQAQAGAVAGSIVFTGRDNANQITLQDGTPGVTNQYLWHPLQAGFYAACTDGAYDQAIIAHEYGHAISNRMVGGPDVGLSGNEGTSMGEAWSDLMALEYQNGYGFVGPEDGLSRYAIAAYATGNFVTAIRNYNASTSPLVYSNLNYDGNGATSPHANSEAWGSASFHVRRALSDKYKSTFSEDNLPLQFACADGLKDAKECPGNRRWAHLMFDAWLLMPAAPSMVDSRDAMLAADKMRFGGANQAVMWTAFAEKGLGQGADAGGTAGFASPTQADEATVRFQAVPVGGQGVPASMKVFAGHYEARTSEIATGAAGKPSGAVSYVPGIYDFIAQAEGYGAVRITRTLRPRETVTIPVPMRKNWASLTHGGEATGDGGNFESLIDDTEATNWAYLGTESDNVEGKQVTVALAGGKHVVREINVSAANRPQETGNAYDRLSNSRFAALRSFDILGCDATKGADCESDDGFTLIYTSAPDAFKTARPRPLAPNLKIQTFDVPDFTATHVRLRVLSNQCTGNPIYSGAENPVGEPLSDPDCVNGFTAAALTGASADQPATINNTQKHRVRVAELQVFDTLTGAAPPPVKPPVIVPPVKKPPKRLPTTGTGAALPIMALLLVLGASYALRSRREA